MLRDLPNDVYFTVGLTTIIGLAAEDAILIIEFAKDLRGKGKPLVEATVEACSLGTPAPSVAQARRRRSCRPSRLCRGPAGGRKNGATSPLP